MWYDSLGNREWWRKKPRGGNSREMSRRDHVTHKSGLSNSEFAVGARECHAQCLLDLTHWPLGDLNFKNAIFNLALLVGIFKSSDDDILRWMPQELTDDESTLVQVMAWCRQATSHYLNQCWPRSPTPYGVTRPQWVNPPGTVVTTMHRMRGKRHHHPV